MYRILLALKCFVLVTNVLFGQNYERTISWPEADEQAADTPKLNQNESQKFYLWFEKNVAYPNQETMLPFYNETISISNEIYNIEQIEVSIENSKFEPLDEGLVELVHPKHIEGSKTSFEVYRSRGNSYLQVMVPALRVSPTSGRLEKLVGFSVIIDEKNTEKQDVKRQKVASQSVLAQGSWHRVEVNETGIHRISYSDLQSMGLSNLENVSVWGHGGRQLPFWNNEPSLDDLLEIPLWLDKGSDGVFNQGDYIYFYATGPVSWQYNDDGFFTHKIHDYSSTISYFVTTSRQNPKRVQSMEPPVANHNNQSNSYDALVYIEKNDTNLIKSGRQWFGDLFDVYTNRTYSTGLNLPVSGGNAVIRVRTAARSSASSSFTVKANGETIGSIPMSSVNTGYQYGSFASATEETFDFSYSQNELQIELIYNKPSPAAKAWLDYITVNARQRLSFGSEQLQFRDAKSIGDESVTLFSIDNAQSGMRVWDVTDFFLPKELEFENQSGTAQLKVETSQLREFIAFLPNQALSVDIAGEVSNQNIHGESQPEMVIVTHPDFYSQAADLAQIHSEDSGLRTLVVTNQEVYNEFSSGTPDVSAIRNMMRMFYNRANSESEMPRYLLLFGDGSYDNITDNSANTNLVLTYQSENSLHVTSSFVSDDYFGLLDENEGESSGMLDIGVGRIPSVTQEEASTAVQKIRNYLSHSSIGSWQNQLSFIGDDGDNNIHMRDANRLGTFVEDNYPHYNVERIFFDAYPLEISSQGGRYPDVTNAINSRANQGALIINYLGHANAKWLAHEKVLMISDIQSWRNLDRLPLFVTATCEFSRFDDFYNKSAGEHALFSTKGGSIGLLSTTRVVYANPNYTLNRNFFQYVFEKSASVNAGDSDHYRLGDVFRLAKVATAGTNKRNFMLLGDPALKLHAPEVELGLNSINGTSVNEPLDTLRALSKVTITGEVSGQRSFDDFQGEAEIILYDKAKDITTLANTGGTPFEFTTRDNVIYKGRLSVTNGQFSASFIIPKDIFYNYGGGRFSLFAHSGLITGSGYFEDFIIGGVSDNAGDDDEGPGISIYMNDEQFVSGGITDTSPKLVVLLADSSGINTTGAGIGHDLTATLKGQTDKRIVLNDYYVADLDSYQSGRAEYQLSNLEVGNYSINVKAWDVFNNSSESEIEFIVSPDEDLKLSHVLNYPNPFTESTGFYFEHNQPYNDFDVSIQIFSPSGKLVKTLEHYFPGNGSFRVGPIYWDGYDDFGDRIGRGVYFYRLRVRLSDGTSVEAYQKLVLLK